MSLNQQSRIFTASCIALVVTAMTFAIRAGILTELGTTFSLSDTELGWINTFWPLIVPKFLATDGFFVFLMVQFIRGLPRDLDEAARIDGCGHVRIFRRIILPLSMPALATTAIFTFIWTWDDFFSQMIYLSDIRLFTVQLGIRALFDPSGSSDWGALLAMSTLSLLPITAVFLAFQRYFLEGIATTGLK